MSVRDSGSSYLESSKVNNAVNLRVLGEDLVEGLLVGDVDLVEGRAATADLFNTVENVLERVVQAVDNDDIVAVLEKGEGGKGANVACTTA